MPFRPFGPLGRFASFLSFGGAIHGQRLHPTPRRLRPSRISSLVDRISWFALPFRGLWPSVKPAAFGFWISTRRGFPIINPQS